MLATSGTGTLAFTVPSNGDYYAHVQAASAAKEGIARSTS